ncbi:MAG: FAD-dependent oxidoreductase [Candidatus Saccharibacteria bacterium]
MANRILIVGGVAGGASAAARLRRLDEFSEIIMFERGEDISFANCGLPYYVGGVIPRRDSLLVQTPRAMKARFNIDVRTMSEVTRIDPRSQEIEVKDLVGGSVVREKYDYLILSPGAAPIKPPLPGIDLGNVFSVRNIPDCDRILMYVDANKPQRAAVIGGGFIGLEMAENLRAQGLKVSVVEMSDQVMPPLDAEMAALVHRYLRSRGIDLYLGDGAVSLDGDKLVHQLTLKSGKTLDTDIVVMGIGVNPEVKLAQEAGLTIGPAGGIEVDEFLRTSDPKIYAVGDAIQVKSFVGGQQVMIPLAGPANKQGRIAADNICGRAAKYEGTLGTSIAKLFDMSIAATGVNEKMLIKLNMNYQVSFTHPAPHATYYPGGAPMSMKLVFSPETGDLYGAQIVGFDGVDKRIDVLATAIRKGLTVLDLQELELAYAPPFSSAKDPVNMAGYVAGNIVKGDAEIVHWHEIEKLRESGSLIIDVRTPGEFHSGAIAGAVNIPVDDLRGRMNEIPKDQPVIIYCRVGLRGYIACRMLKQYGYDNVKNLSGGYLTYDPAVNG